MTAPRLPRALTGLAGALSLLAGALLLVLAVLTVADVAGRSLFDRSIVGTVDISTMLLVGVAFLGLAAAQVDGRHVDVDLVEARLPQGARVVLAIVRCVLLVGLGAVLVWGLTDQLMSAYDRGETTNDILRLPTWPAKLALVVSYVLFFVTAIWSTVNDVRVLRRGEDLAPSWADQAADESLLVTPAGSTGAAAGGTTDTATAGTTDTAPGGTTDTEGGAR
ncbi:TRAP transporter small permease subunit [Georgenia sp. Z1344]|uniref:TRAP transporter small permease subunit n=1 Tax=Georgenia sp. Z1344 TaxID=3416706 RepID=UPI003CF84C0C